LSRLTKPAGEHALEDTACAGDTAGADDKFAPVYPDDESEVAIVVNHDWIRGTHGFRLC